MGSSRQPGVLRTPFPWAAARTAGPLGYRDQADPLMCTLLGDTPGPLGRYDWGDPVLPRPSFARSSLARTTQGQPISLPLNASASIETAPGTLGMTADELQLVFPQASRDYLSQVVSELGTNPVAYGLDTPLRRAHFFAQVREESGADMQAISENLNYKSSALTSIFKYYRNNPTEADTDGYERDAKTGKLTRAASQETIANKAYAGRNGNGDAASGDGWRYRGRGLIQLTGRSNYSAIALRYAKVYGDSTIDFVKQPDLILDFPYSVRSAVCYWLEHGLHKLADKGSTTADVDRITRVVNSATDSYTDRQEHFAIAFEAFQ